MQRVSFGGLVKPVECANRELHSRSLLKLSVLFRRIFFFFFFFFFDTRITYTFAFNHVALATDCGP